MHEQSTSALFSVKSAITMSPDQSHINALFLDQYRVPRPVSHQCVLSLDHSHVPRPVSHQCSVPRPLSCPQTSLTSMSLDHSHVPRPVSHQCVLSLDHSRVPRPVSHQFSVLRPVSYPQTNLTSMYPDVLLRVWARLLPNTALKVTYLQKLPIPKTYMQFCLTPSWASFLSPGSLRQTPAERAIHVLQSGHCYTEVSPYSHAHTQACISCVCCAGLSAEPIPILHSEMVSLYTTYCRVI